MAITTRGNLLADRYRVVGRLGAGGMAVVVLAEDERLGRKVAVKRLHTAETGGDTGRRFQREARLGASLNHPNIVAVYDIACHDEDVLIVMEYVDGHTLRQEMDSGPMEPSRVLEVLSGIAAGLDHAHEQGVIHRDVKPANVLIAESGGGVKITDLGIATAAERTNITGSGVVLGTAAYMAPERLDGEAGGPPVDVYATAAVAFEALSGRKAVTGKTAMEVARRVMSAPAPDLRDVVAGAPARAAAALQRGMAKDPGERQSSVNELVRELTAAYAETAERSARPAAAVPAAKAASAPAPPPPPTTRPRRPAPARRTTESAPRRRSFGWLVPAALALAAAVVVAIVLLAGSGSGGGSEEQAQRGGSGGAAGQSDSGSGSGSDTGSGGDSSSAAPAPDGDGSTPAPNAGGSQPGSTPATPTGAVSTFYTRAAEDDFHGAWDLGTDRLHAQFGSLDRFTGTFDTLEKIAFPKLETTAENGDTAKVAFRSVATHTSYTDRCTATASLVRAGGAWLVDHLDAVDCKRG